MRRAILRAWIAGLMLAAAGCASVPGAGPTVQTGHGPSDYPKNAAEGSGAAVKALLAQADQNMQSGLADKAIAKLENALRIESRNPFVWQKLARVHLLEHRWDQAESIAFRSISLGKGNPWLELDNWRVIAIARRERGDTAGAGIADAKVAELQTRIGL